MSRRNHKQNHLFLNWLKANRSRFPFEPQIVLIKGSFVRGRFKGITPEIWFYFSDCEIVVDVFFAKRCWDLLVDFPVEERRASQGYYCGLCIPEAVIYYPTRETLRTKHVFEPFLAWCNEDLAVQKWLALYEYGDPPAATEANLQNDDSFKENPVTLHFLQNMIRLPIKGEMPNQNPSKDPLATPQIKKDYTQKLVRLLPVVKRSGNPKGTV